MIDPKRTSLTVRVPEEVAKRFKVKCAMESVTGQEILEKAIYEYLGDSKKQSE